MDPAPLSPARKGHRQELLAGALVLGGVLAILVALFTLTDASLFRGRYVLTTRVPDAGGIRKGDPVQMRGVNIGRVTGFSIERDGVEIRLELEGEFRVPADSRMELKSGGLLGGTVAEVVPGQSTEMLEDGGSLPGKSGMAALDGVEQLTNRAEAALSQVQAMVSPETARHVATSSAELERLLKELSGAAVEQRRELAALTKSLRRSAAGVEGAVAGPELARAVKRLDALAARMDAVSASLERSSGSLEVVMGRIERGEGTLGRLSKDDTLYLSLNAAATNVAKAGREVGALSEDLRLHPERYVKLSFF
jgi:phospholipid/cholesterol/gamma-HCH transport system substrate-binding protein